MRKRNDMITQNCNRNGHNSTIFMEDSAADVEKKILAAYCPSEEEKTEMIQDCLTDFQT